GDRWRRNGGSVLVGDDRGELLGLTDRPQRDRGRGDRDTARHLGIGGPAPTGGEKQARDQEMPGVLARAKQHARYRLEEGGARVRPRRGCGDGDRKLTYGAPGQPVGPPSRDKVLISLVQCCGVSL